MPKVIKSVKIGSKFLEARSKLNLSLKDISKNIHINIRYLEAIESDDYSLFPARAFAIGYFNKYSDFLGIKDPFPVNTDDRILNFKENKTKSSRKRISEVELFIKENLINDWPLIRKIMTYARHILVKTFLDMNLDASGAYRCFYLKKIKLKDILDAKNNEYAFFWEVTYIIKKRNYSIHEIPAKLIYRKLGKSKMNFKHIIYSLIYLLKIFLIKK